MNVTPESEVPIIPKATMYQGDSLFPKKNDSFPSFFPVNREITERNKKYTKYIVNKLYSFFCIKNALGKAKSYICIKEENYDRKSRFNSKLRC